MLRIDDAVSQRIYEVELKYECRTENGSAFDYLTGIAEKDAGAAQIEPGPGRTRADTSIPIPDDATIDFDGGDSRFQVWGGIFQDTPKGPLPAVSCAGEKLFRVNLIARDDAVFLIWAGHLASSREWGDNQGASSQTSPVHVEVTVNSTSQQRLGVGPGAISP